MNDERTKARTRRSRATPSKAVQKNLLAAAPHKGAEIPQSPVNGGLARDATPVQTAKRRLDATSEIDLLPAKRTRSTGAQRFGVEEAEQADKTTGRHPRPEPKPPKRRNTSLPEPSVERQEQVSPTTPVRKRQIDCDSNDNGHQLKRARLTRKNLAHFNKMEKKKTSNNASASDPPESTDESATTKDISTSSSGFAARARDNGILDPVSSRPPTNLQDIRERHARSRETASPTELKFKDYVSTVAKTRNEMSMVVEVSQRLLKLYDDDEGYIRAFNQPITGFPKNVGFNNGLSAPQPDFVEGIDAEECRPFPVGNHIAGAVLYKDDPHSVTLPHLAGEWKGPGKDMTKAKLQSAFDGAALVYARNQALSYLGKSDPPGHAEITTFTTDGTTINSYAHYAVRSEDGTLEYHQYPVKSTNLVDSHQGFRDGRRGLRNEQDHARDQSRALRDQLKEHWKQRRSGLQPIAEGAPLPGADGTFEETNGDEDEDEAGYEVVEQPHES